MASSTLSTILRARGQGPVLMLSLGHGATHWITGTVIGVDGGEDIVA